MDYKYSQIDKDNLEWFKRDDSKATLLSIHLEEGHLRGLSNFEISFEYPISVISGKNGAGKSTILAMAACAFHNDRNGFKLPQRKNSYYTFSDFFIQSDEELPPDGIKISYYILHDNWRKTNKHPDGKGIGRQIRRKKIGGKWNDYSERVKRNVVYYGVERIVPPSEKSVSKSYRHQLQNKDEQGWERLVKATVGRILNKDYTSFWYKEYTKYRLPIVKMGNNSIYSGFNMGAGENALFEIFSTIYSCSPGLLLVIDEIELGLHEEAQKRFIDELKEVCNKRKVQIICTSHSFVIMSAVPPEARFFVETFGERTIITPKISPLYAAGKLSGENSNELDIFVEDTIAKTLLELAISSEIRTRVNILPIGSSKAISNQLAARYKNLKKGDCIAILDGDQRSRRTHINQEFINSLESYRNKNEAEKWISERINFLPGNVWPEKWIIEQTKNSRKYGLLKELSIDEDKLIEYLNEALRANRHDELYVLSKKVNLDKSAVLNFLVRHVVNIYEDEFEDIRVFVNNFLK